MGPLYLRISVTDRCNLRCVYCRGDSGPTCVGDELTNDEWVELVCSITEVAPVGKIRFTGGEPLLRSGLGGLARALSCELPGARLCLTTNGLLLPRTAAHLRAAGVEAINISLDAPHQAGLTRATGGGELAAVVRGIEAAQDAGFDPIKLNAVLLRTYNGDQLERLVALAARMGGLELRFIELMPIGVAQAIFDEEYLGANEALARIGRHFPVEAELDRQGTARHYRLRVAGESQIVGFITPVSDPFCSTCNRLRIDSRGRLFGCLRQSHAVDLAGPLRRGGRGAVAEIVRAALRNKRVDPAWPDRAMVAIGG